MLRGNRSLTRLDASYQHAGGRMGEVGARALATALRENGTLTSLDIEGNDVGAAGARAVLAAVNESSTLLSLGQCAHNPLARNHALPALLAQTALSVRVCHAPIYTLHTRNSYTPHAWSAWFDWISLTGQLAAPGLQHLTLSRTARAGIHEDNQLEYEPALRQEIKGAIRECVQRRTAHA
jgi:hypothetical protein